MIFIFSESVHEDYFLDYINSIIVNYPNDIRYINENSYFTILPTDIIIFIQNIPIHFDVKELHCKIYLLNTEQLSSINQCKKINNISNEIEIIDYSLANIDYLYKERLVSNTNIGKNLYYLPYMVNRNEIFNYPKIKDIAIIGWWDLPYRMNILSEISQLGLDFNEIEGFSNKRDEELFQYKILVNVHFNEEYKIFEQMRCNRCIMNRMIVISEKSYDVYYELRPYMIECEYSEIAEKTKDVLENYERYYKELFENFDIDKIESIYKNIADKCLR